MNPLSVKEVMEAVANAQPQAFMVIAEAISQYVQNTEEVVDDVRQCDFYAKFKAKLEMAQMIENACTAIIASIAVPE
jgi:hypothetical protein